MSKNITNQDLINYSRQFHEALGMPFKLPPYRKVIPRTDGKHSATFEVYLSYEPPSKSDVGIKRATNSKSYPTG
jgi:hypothetical protein